MLAIVVAADCSADDHPAVVGDVPDPTPIIETSDSERTPMETSRPADCYQQALVDAGYDEDYACENLPQDLQDRVCELPLDPDPEDPLASLTGEHLEVKLRDNVDGPRPEVAAAGARLTVERFCPQRESDVEEILTRLGH